MLGNQSIALLRALPFLLKRIGCLDTPVYGTWEFVCVLHGVMGHPALFGCIDSGAVHSDSNTP
jgi:hypothetical protein